MADKNEQDAVEKGFNDSELADIMSEIETLERDLDDDGEVEATSAPEEESSEEEEEVVEVKAEQSEEDTDDSIVDNLKEMPVEAVAGKEEIVDNKVDNNVENIVAVDKVSSAATKLDFSVEGDMTLHLRFHVAGQSIDLDVNGEEGLVIQLGNGAKFCVPVDSEIKKAS